MRIIVHTPRWLPRGRLDCCWFGHIVYSQLDDIIHMIRHLGIPDSFQDTIAGRDFPEMLPVSHFPKLVGYRAACCPEKKAYLVH